MSSGQIPLWSPQAKHSRFDNFQVELESVNALLVENLRDYILHADTTPFFISGESGSGKTHIQLAATNLSRELGFSDTRYVDCRSASVHYSMLDGCMEASCLCLDNIDAWSGNAAAEQALFAVVEKIKNAPNNIPNNAQRLIVSAKKSPKNNDFSLADLVSRLASGVVFELTTLDDVGKFKALQHNVNERNLKVNNKVLHHLLTHFARDNHSLFSALDKLDRASLIEKRKLTIPFVKEVLRS